MKSIYEKMTYEALTAAVHRKEPEAEAELFKKCRKYFMDNKGIMKYLRSDVADDVFQEAFLVIWTEIQNGKIFVNEGKLARIKSDGKAARMNCALPSFLMAIAKNIYLKIVRHEGPAMLVDIEGKDFMGDAIDYEPMESEIQRMAVDDAMESLSAHCREILTLFYVKGLSLEQILVIRPENSSKDGLKTSKSKCLKQLKGKAELRRSLYE